MTIEKAIDRLRKISEKTPICTNGDDLVAITMAIQALSQEPCDDTVSIRKDVLKYRVGKLVAYNVEWLKKHWQMEMDIVCGVKPCDDAVSRQDALNCLTGKWIKMFRTDTGDIDSQCSECGFIHKFIDGHTAQYNYCPNCSAKMESEVGNGWNV